MKKTILFLLLAALSSPAWSRPNLPYIPPPPPPSDESWIKLTCFGIVSPRFASPTVERQIMIAHVKFDGYGRYPRFDDLRDKNSGFFKNFTKACTERRRARVELGDFTGQWMDWGSDWGYSRYDVGEVFISAANSGACRGVGGPCVSNNQCCGSNRFMATCNVPMNTCESTIIYDKANTVVPSKD